MIQDWQTKFERCDVEKEQLLVNEKKMKIEQDRSSSEFSQQIKTLMISKQFLEGTVNDLEVKLNNIQKENRDLAMMVDQRFHELELVRQQNVELRLEGER
jgi:hypothetical protein